MKAKLIKYWDDDLGDYYFRLEREALGIYYQFKATGDEDWAKRQAKHYGIRIEIEEEEES